MTNNNQSINNSVSISGGNVTGNQFAAGSTNFSGTINNINDPQKEKLEQLTGDLISALQSESEKLKDTNTNVDEITDAINQAKAEASKDNVNKLSLNGLLTGINMVMGNINSLSTTTMNLYQQWHGHITALFT